LCGWQKSKARVSGVTAASIAGGFLGARVAQRLPPAAMRGVSIAVGLYAAVRFLAR